MDRGPIEVSKLTLGGIDARNRAIARGRAWWCKKPKASRRGSVLSGGGQARAGGGRQGSNVGG